MNFAPAQWGDVCIILLSLLVQGIPFLLFGTILGGLIAAWTPFSALLRRWPKSSLLAALTGAIAALLLPACDCAALPVVRRLIRKGIPVSAGVAYLLAAPVFNPICMISTFLAFRLGSPWQMLALREGGSLLVAITVAVLASKLPPAILLKSSVLTGSSASSDPLPWMQMPRDTASTVRLWPSILAATLVDFLNVGTLFVLGALFSAVFQSFVPLQNFTALRGTGFGVPLAMATAFLLSQCSAADAFVVNGFGALGMAGQLAFLWLGPIYNLRVLFLYRTIFRYQAILLLGAASALIILAMAFLLQASGVCR